MSRPLAGRPRYGTGFGFGRPTPPGAIASGGNSRDAGARIGSVIVAIGALAWACGALAADYSVIAEQNLFDPQRKPWPDPAAAAAAPVATASPLGPEDLQVQGVVVHGGVRRAIVRLGGRLRELAPDAAAGRFNVILREGQAVGGYTLESVGAQQLVFVFAGKRVTVPFVRSARRDLAAATPAPLPVIQSATLPVTAPRPAAPTTRRATRRTPARATTAQRPAQAAAPFQEPPGAQTGAAATAASGADSAAAPAAPAGGMSLLQAIQAAEAARRAGKAPAAPPFNPFAPRSP